MITTIIFDCFGVLATEGWVPFRDKTFGHDPTVLREANDLMSALSCGLLAPAEFMERMAELSGMHVDALYPVFYTNTPNEELFQWIRERKDTYAFGVLSNIGSGRFEEIFSKQQQELFDSVVLSHEIGFIKPDRRAYEVAAKKLGVAPRQCLFVDDQQKNVLAAQETGMLAIPYTDFAQFEAAVEKLLD
jgi:putative hydrolase of the HAD superfamily